MKLAIRRHRDDRGEVSEEPWVLIGLIMAFAAITTVWTIVAGVTSVHR
jgi:hypothetical protein